MALKTLPPMAEGGIWLHLPHKNGAEYVVHEAHIKRLLGEGARPVDDPRVPQEETEQTPAPTANETAMQARIDQLEAMLKQLLAAKSEQVNDTSTTNDGITDSPNPQADKRSGRGKSSV